MQTRHPSNTVRLSYTVAYAHSNDLYIYNSKKKKYVLNEEMKTEKQILMRLTEYSSYEEERKDKAIMKMAGHECEIPKKKNRQEKWILLADQKNKKMTLIVYSWSRKDIQQCPYHLSRCSRERTYW